MVSKIKNGDVFTTNENYKIIVTNYINANNIFVKFENNVIIKVRYNQLLSGSIKNPYHKSVYNIGYFGIGPYKSSINNKSTKAHHIWNHMIERCYSERCQNKHPTYIGCSVDKEWHNFQNFAKWYEENYIENYDLDKDLLKPNNKIYSKNTCVFLPKYINGLLSINYNNNRGLPVGINKIGNKYRVRCGNNNKNIHLGMYNTLTEALDCYKNYKEKIIKNVAKEYYSKNLICMKIYIALNNYKINNK